MGVIFQGCKSPRIEVTRSVSPQGCDLTRVEFFRGVSHLARGEILTGY